MQFLYKIINLSTFLVPLLCIVGFIIGMYNYKKLTTDYKILTFLFLYTLANEIFSYVTAIYLGSNLFFISIYALAELFFLYSFLRLQKKRNKKYFDFLFALLIAFNFYEIFNVNFLNFDLFQTYSRSLNSIFLLGTGLLIILHKLNKEEFDASNKLLIALPCFVTINALIYLPLNVLINYKDISVYVVWFVNVLNLIVFFSIIIYQIWKFGKIQKV